MTTPLLRLTEQGLYCEAGAFYIDPLRRVETALVTHAHADHARRGSRRYHCAEPSLRLLQRRLGGGAAVIGAPYREKLRFGSVTASFHPAGHILGSAQIRVATDEGEVWVVSGDYKREPDPTCEPFEVVPCDMFITEATFGHPAYEWGDTAEAAREILGWWEENRRLDRNALLFCYALGKAQRILAELGRLTDRRVLVWGETAALTACYREQGVQMAQTAALEELPAGEKIRGELVLAPHSIGGTPWMLRLGSPSTAFASGWMRTGAFGTFRSYDRGFVLSDHADWPGLIRTVHETGARRVRVYHGHEGGVAFARHLRRLGLDAAPLEAPPARGRGADVQGELFSP